MDEQKYVVYIADVKSGDYPCEHVEFIPMNNYQMRIVTVDENGAKVFKLVDRVIVEITDKETAEQLGLK